MHRWCLWCLDNDFECPQKTNSLLSGASHFPPTESTNLHPARDVTISRCYTANSSFKKSILFASLQLKSICPQSTPSAKKHRWRIVPSDSFWNYLPVQEHHHCQKEKQTRRCSRRTQCDCTWTSARLKLHPPAWGFPCVSNIQATTEQCPKPAIHRPSTQAETVLGDYRVLIPNSWWATSHSCWSQKPHSQSWYPSTIHCWWSARV